MVLLIIWRRGTISAKHSANMCIMRTLERLDLRLKMHLGIEKRSKRSIKTKIEIKCQFFSDYPLNYIVGPKYDEEGFTKVDRYNDVFEMTMMIVVVSSIEFILG